MAGEALKKWTIVKDIGGFVVLCDANSMPLGIVKEDCYMGDIVEIVLFGVSRE